MFDLFCNHRWSPWEFKIVSKGFYDEESWYERLCYRCGKIEQKDFVVLKTIDPKANKK